MAGAIPLGTAYFSSKKILKNRCLNLTEMKHRNLFLGCHDDATKDESTEDLVYPFNRINRNLAIEGK